MKMEDECERVYVRWEIEETKVRQGQDDEELAACSRGAIGFPS